MKHTPQISSNQRNLRRGSRVAHRDQSFPLTDYNFHATAETEASLSAGRPATKLPAFHRLSSEFFGAEAIRHFVAELLFFMLITTVSAWPIISMLVAVTRLVRNY